MLIIWNYSHFSRVILVFLEIRDWEKGALINTRLVPDAVKKSYYCLH